MSKYHIGTEIAHAKQWAEHQLKDYIEPTREGSRRGDPIGLSKTKMFAAHLMPLHPEVPLKTLAKESGVSNGVLKVWRTQEGFKKAMGKAAFDIGNDFASRYIHYRRNADIFSDAKKPKDAEKELKMADDVIGVVASLNEGAVSAFFDQIRIIVDFEYPEVANIVNFEIYDRFNQYLAMREGRLDEYARRPGSVKMTKKLISLILTMMTVEKDRSKREEYANRLRQLTSDYIDLLA